jgi:cytochrome b561
MTNKDYSKIYRILHWAIALSMMFLLLTIFLRMTWMNKNNVSDIIQEFLKSTDQTLSEDDSISLAKQIRKPMWIWHIYIGYVLVFLFAIRFTLPFFGEMKFQSPFNKSLDFKGKFKAWVYVIFYLGITMSLTTGLFIEFGPDSLYEIMEEIHVLSIYYLLTFIALHLLGVIGAELTNDKGIVSRIISGKKK